MNTKKHLLIAVLVALTVSQAFSQGAGRRLYPGASRARSNASAPISRKLAYPWTLTLGLGYASEFGQLKTWGAGFGPTDPQFNLGIRYRFSTRFTVGATVRIFSVSGNDTKSSDVGRADRGIIQSTSCKEIQLIGMYDIIPIITRFMGDKTDQYNRRNPFVPYVFGGVGLLMFDPSFTDPITNKPVSISSLRLAADNTGTPINGFGTLTPTLSLGVGFRIKVSEFFDIGADLSYTSTFTDYLDGIAKNTYYYDPSKVSGIKSDELMLSDPNSAYVALASGFTGNYLASMNDPNFNSTRNLYTTSTSIGQTKGGTGGSGKDGYFLLNVRVDYTLSSLKNIGKQKAHRHFQRGKGSYHHKFQRK